jgi:Fe2+ transport system protein FeoA
MNCWPTPCDSSADRTWVPERGLQAVLGRAERLRSMGMNRGAATLVLQAAASAEGVALRDCLRRRAAELISPRAHTSVPHPNRTH